MNKKHVSDNKFENFLSVLTQTAIHFGIMSERNVAERVDLLIEALQNKIRDMNSSNKKKTGSNAFIKLFMGKFMGYTGQKYTIKIEPYHIVLIQGLMKELESIYYDFGEYLDWFFDDYYPKQKNLSAPNINLICSENMLLVFKCEHTSEIEKRKELALREREEDDVLNKLEMLYRKSKDERLLTLSSNYDHGDLNIMELKEEVDAFEKKLLKKNNNKKSKKKGVKKK